MSALQEQFVTEARELIRQATDDLIALERDGASPERIDRVFRAFHTLKGSAGVVELPAMSVMLHAAEDLLAGVRPGRSERSRKSSMPRWHVSIRCRAGSTISRPPARCPRRPARMAARWRNGCDRCLPAAAGQQPGAAVRKSAAGGGEARCRNGLRG